MHEPRARSNAAGVFMTKTLRFVLAARFAALTATFTLLAASSVHAATPCENLAKQVASQIDGLKVNFSAANIVYLTHPAAKELSLGCRGRDYSSELYAKGDRKPKPEFYQLVASATALVFTLPKDDTLTGATRCLKRMGLLRGDKVKMRYRRLNMECTRTKHEAAIVIRRDRDD